MSCQTERLVLRHGMEGFLVILDGVLCAGMRIFVGTGLFGAIGVVLGVGELVLLLIWDIVDGVGEKLREGEIYVVVLRMFGRDQVRG